MKYILCMKNTPLVALMFAVACLWAMPLQPAHGNEVIPISPAQPQPDASALEPGLAVKYAYPGDIKTLSEAESWRGYDPKPGEPLVGFYYPDTKRGEKVLTSGSSEYVVAFIDGYIRFEEAGTHFLEFWANDGLRVELGGKQVYEHDFRHPCETLGPVAVEVAEPGWYPVEALFFQRTNTACLGMRMKPPGGVLDWVEPEMYAHVPE
jgi:hypothetical protein